MTATAVATIQPRGVLADMATRYGMLPEAFEKTLRATVVPATASREQFAAFLLVAKEYGLNPLTKEIYAFPTRQGGIQPIVSIDGWANILNSHPAFNGLEFHDHVDANGNVTAITARIYRKDRERPIEVTEYFAECKRNTDTWKQWPRRMLRHKATIQAARYAFGFAGIIDPDEFERMESVTANAAIPPPPPPPRLAAPQMAPGDDVVVWDDPPETLSGEVEDQTEAAPGTETNGQASEPGADHLQEIEGELRAAAARGMAALRAEWSAIHSHYQTALKTKLDQELKPMAEEADAQRAQVPFQ